MFKIGSARSPHSPENLPPETGHSCLTYGNVAASLTPGNHTAETALAGWGARIRTWEWRNQIPQFGLFQQWSF